MDITDSYNFSATFSPLPVSSSPFPAPMTIIASESFDMEFDIVNELLSEYPQIELLEELGNFPNYQEELTDTSGSCDAIASPYHDDRSDPGLDENDNDSLDLWDKKKRVKSQGISRKEEIKSLRKEAQALKTKLKSLMYRKKQNRSTGNERDLSSGGLVSTRNLQLWKQMARSQLRRRHAAEAENTTLQEMVALQVLEAKNLRRILKRRTRLEMMQSMLGTAGIERLQNKIPAVSSCDFQKLLDDADAIASGINNLFLVKRIKTLPYTGHARQSTLEVTNGTYFEIQMQRVFPFSIEETSRAVWECLRKLGLTDLRGVMEQEVQFNAHQQYFEEEGDTLRSSFLSVVSGIQELAGTFTRKVARRKTTAERSVFICRMESEPKFFNNRIGVSAITTTHIVLERPTTLDGGEGDTTVMKFYFSAERNMAADSIDSTALLAIAAWEELVPRFPSDVETSLLDGSVR